MDCCITIDSHFRIFVFFALLLTANAACPVVHGQTVISRSLVDTNGQTALNTGNPITCDGYVTGWRFFPTVSTQFVALIMRPYKAADNKYVVVGRTIIPEQEVLNEVREYKVQESDWISVKSGDIIGFKIDTALLPYDSGSGSAYMFASGIDQHQLITFTIHTLTDDGGQGNREYSFQAILKDSYLPCDIVTWPFMDVEAETAGMSRIWMDDWNKIKCPGRITGWRFAAKGSGEIDAIVFRQLSDNNEYEVIGKTTIPEQSEYDVITEYPLPLSQQIEVLPGDKIGFAFTDRSMGHTTIVSNVESFYKYTSKPDNYEVGAQVTFSNYKIFRFMLDAILDIKEPTNTHLSFVNIKDLKLPNSNYQTMTGSNLLTCITSCIDDQQCQSINYNEQQQNCELNDATIAADNYENFVVVGERYAEMTQKITKIHDNCAFVDCGPGNICINHPNSKKRYLCVCSATGYLAMQCPPAECLAPLGMESGDIVDDQITANSVYSSGFGPQYGRLRVEAGSGGTWCADSSTPNVWIQVDLLVEHNITGIQTQGRSSTSFSEWVITYTVSYITVKQLGETFISDGHGVPKIFDGNWERNHVRTHYFNPVIQAVSIKIHPKDYSNYRCLRAEVLGCRTGSEWVRVFKGVSMTGDSIYNAWQTGVDTSSYYAHQFLISDTFYRNNVIFDSWSSRNIQQVKLTLFSQFNEELLSIIFNGVDTTPSSWFTRDRIQSSPWDDIKTSTLNIFSITGDDTQSRRFFMNSYYENCKVDAGWLAVVEGNGCTEWEGYNTNPRIIYSKTNKAQAFFSGDVGTARAITVDVTFGW